MTDPTERDPDEGPHPPGIQNVETCAECNTAIDRSSWHYVGYGTANGCNNATGDEEDGRATAVVLCSMRCYHTWFDDSG